MVSKRVAALERRLGVRLIERTTRRIRLTEAALRLVDKLRSARRLIAEAQQEASEGAVQLRGKLRLAFPAAMGRMWLAAMLPDFLARYPDLEVEVDYAERFVDLVAEGYDAAVRVGVLADNRLIARRLCDHRRILCASPGYLERRGIPQAPAEIAAHACLGFTGYASYPEWRLSDGKRRETVEVRGALRANDTAALLEAARADVGILGVGECIVARDLAAGTLVRVLPEWSFDTEAGIHIVRPSARLAPARTTAFAEWIIERFTPAPPWDARLSGEG